MTRHTTLTALIAGFTLTLASIGCGGSTVKNPEDDFKKAPPIEDDRPSEQQQRAQELGPQKLEDKVFVDAQGFTDLVNNQNATVIDGRTKEAYNQGHYPEAFHSGNKSGYKPFKTPEYNDILPRKVSTLQKEAREMGVYNDRPVVIYATPGSKRAGRLLWALEYLGKGEAYIYTPGYKGLKNNLDFDPSTETVDKTGDFLVRRREKVLATNEDVEKAAEGQKNAVLLDTRRSSEFTGDEVRAPRHGYIPNAIFYHWEWIFDQPKEKVKNGDPRNLRDMSDLKQEFKQKGLIAADTVLVPYCQTGTRSSYIYAVLRELQNETDVTYTPQNYDGSWTRYARINGTPVNHDGEERLPEEAQNSETQNSSQ